MGSHFRRALALLLMAMVPAVLWGQSAGTNSSQTTPTRGVVTPMMPIDPIDPKEPAGAYILAPAAGSTFAIGSVISFQGETDLGTTFLWTFGDGTTSTALNPSKAYATAGTYSVSFRASGTGLIASTARVTITVAGPSIAVSPANPFLVPVGTQAFTATVYGLANTAVTWSATAGTITSAGVFTAPSTEGMVTITATGSDNQTKGSVNVTVAVPRITLTPPAVALKTGGIQTFTATVTGLANTAVTWSLPGGSGTGTVTSGGVYTAPGGIGSFTLLATASNGLTAPPANIVVSHAPTFVTTLTNQSLVQGKPFTLALPLATDADGDAITYNATGFPAGLSFTTYPPLLIGTPTASGTFTVTETATDVNGVSNSQSSTFTVVANLVPVFSSVAPTQNLVVGAPYSYALPLATDGNGDSITYSISTSNLPAGLTFTAAPPKISGVPTASGVYSMTYTATDAKGAPASQTFSMRVAPNNVPTFSPVTSIPTLYAAVNQSFILQMPGAKDADQEPLIYSFPNWANYSTNLAGVSFNSNTMVLSGSIPAAGTYALNFQAADPKGGVTTLSFSIVVTTSNPVSFGGTSILVPTLTVGTTFSSLPLPPATDTGLQTITYSVIGLPEGLTFNSTSRVVSGTPLLAGQFHLTYTATVPRGYQAQLTSDWTVASAVKLPPVFQDVIPVAYSLKVDVTNLAPPYSYIWPSATDPNLGNTSLNYTVDGSLPPGMLYNGTARTVSGKPTTCGTYPVTYKVTDSFGQSASQSTTFVVEQELPSLTTPFQAAPNTISSGQSSTLSWAVTGADSVTISPTPTVVTSTTATVTPTTTTAYLLTATNAAGSVTAMVVVNVAGTSGVGSIGGGASLPVPSLSDFTATQFEEALGYEWSGGTTTGTRSFTGLITSVDVTRQLHANLAGLTTASTKDRAPRSHYDYGYDRLGQLLQANGTFYDDLAGTVPGWTDLTQYAYDAHGNRAKVTAPSVGASARASWDYTYAPGTNRLLKTPGGDFQNAPIPTAGQLAAEGDGFGYTPDGAVAEIWRNGNLQKLTYNDPRFMRLPTRMERITADGRSVISDLVYDMSGTRIYKRDQVNQTSGTNPLISDRSTYYLANGTEVLMEVESKGATAGAVAPDRYTAYIFGAGNRLARLSWDMDGRGAMAPLLNGTFKTGLEGWTASGANVGLAANDASLGAVAKVINQTTGSDYLEQSLGAFKANDRVDATALVRSEGAAAARVELVLFNLSTGAMIGTPVGSSDVLATTWQSKTATYALLPSDGEVRVRLRAVGNGTLSGALFDNVTVRRLPQSYTSTGKPNLWPDPGFEGVLVPDANVTITGTVGLVADGTNREGLKLLNVSTGGTYTRKITGLVPNGTYRFSIWSAPASSGPWSRQVDTSTALRTADPAGTLSIALSPGYYDQAELIPAVSTDSIPESWIPENRLGRVDWFITDHLGSTKLLIDQNGQHRFMGDDDPYGINLRSFGDKDSHRFTGQTLDEEQGLYYYGARYYLSEIGRFLSGDPHGAKFSNSVYCYVFNNPTALTDPDGYEPQPRQDKNPNWRTTPEERELARDYWNKAKAWVHGTLDAAGFFPAAGAIPDLANAGIYALEGEWKEAGWSTIFAVPVIGDLIAGGKKGMRAVEITVKVKKGADATKETKKAIEAARKAAVRKAWKQEKKLVQETGEGSRRWTKAEKAELLEKGKVKGYEGHHINDVHTNPELARDPNNIEFVRGRSEHLERHGGNFRNPTSGDMMKRE